MLSELPIGNNVILTDVGSLKKIMLNYVLSNINFKHANYKMQVIFGEFFLCCIQIDILVAVIARTQLD